ncbi:hypothetical protein Tco_1253304 [Tanacetum coccineum]
MSKSLPKQFQPGADPTYSTGVRAYPAIRRGILDGQKNNVCNSCSDEPKFPPGFTPDNNDHEKNVVENIKDTTERVQSLSNKLNDRLFEPWIFITEAWSKEANKSSNDKKINIQHNLSEVDKLINQGKSNDKILIKRIMLLNDLHELNNRNAMEISQKAKIRWSIEGDEKSKYFHGIMNKKRSQLTIRGTLANEEWILEPHRVKNEFFTHTIFAYPSS